MAQQGRKSSETKRVEEPAAGHVGWPLQYGSHQAQGRRPNMEDAVMVQHLSTGGGLPLTVAIVADGIGGNAYGERASALTVETLFNIIRQSPVKDPAHISALLRQALEKANRSVYEEGRNDKDKQGMGSTAVVVAVYEQQLYLVNVGDSRAYLVRNGRTHQLTQDHTWAREMVSQGKLKPKEAESHYKAGELVRSVGYLPEVKVDMGIYFPNAQVTEEQAEQVPFLRLEVGDRVVLCSDGLIKEHHNGAGFYVTGPEIAEMVAQYEPAKAAEALVKRAISRNADDNVSVAVLETPGSQRVVPYQKYALYAGGGLGILLVFMLIVVLFAAAVRSDNKENDEVTQVPIALLPGDETGTITETPTRAPIDPADAAYEVTVVTAAAGARWQDGSAPLSQQIMTIVGDQSTLITGGDGSMELLLPGDGHLFIGVDTNITFQTPKDEALILEIGQGALVIQTNGQPVKIQNEFNVWGQIQMGLVGVMNTQNPFRFEVACFQGPCVLHGDLGGELVLESGQAGFVGGNGLPALAPDGIKNELYLFAEVVPTPTATATPTFTPTATNTATPTNTRPRPTNTLTPIPPPTLSPTDTPQSSGGGGSGNGGGNVTNMPPPQR